MEKFSDSRRLLDMIALNERSSAWVRLGTRNTARFLSGVEETLLGVVGEPAELVELVRAADMYFLVKDIPR